MTSPETESSCASVSDVLSILTFELSSRDLARTVAGALENLVDPPPDALSLFEREGPGTAWRITAYYAEPPVINRLHETLEAIVGSAIPLPRKESVPNLNWVAISQAALPPVHAGRFTIHGAHDREKVPQGAKAILIEAGEAFGTAHHATTYGCLLAIDRLTRIRQFRRVLDLGCGSGVLAIAIARADPRAHILASDIDAASVRVASENIAKNRAATRIRTVMASGLRHKELRRHAPYDLLIANILAGPLLALAKDVSHSVNPGGYLVLSGLLDEQSAQIRAAYRAFGFITDQQARIAGWTTLVLRRISALPPRRSAAQMW